MPAINDIADLPRLKFAGKLLHPLRENYNLSGGYGARLSSAAGGMPFVRRDTVSNAQLVTVSFELRTPEMVDWFQMFWKIKLLEGSVPFVCLLSLGESYPKEYVAIPTSPVKYTEMRGYNTIITFDVAAELIVENYEYWDFILYMSEQVEPMEWVNRLAKLVNVDFTESLGSI